MYEENARKIRFFYGVFLGALSGVLAFLLIAEAAEIYDSGLALGGEIYTRALVGERLLPMCGLFALWILAAVGGYVLSVLLPYAESASRRRDDGKTVRRLLARVPAGEGAEFLAERKKFRRYGLLRFAMWTVCALFAVAAGVITIVYLAKTSHFPAENAPAEILGLVKYAAPWVGASFVLFAAAALSERFLHARRLASVKRLLVLGKGAAPVPVSPLREKRDALIAGMGSEKTTLVLRVVLFVLAVSLIVWGAVNGGARDVLIKAVNICTECIGLG